MNKIIIISCLTSLFLTIVLGVSLDPSVIDKLNNLGQKIDHSMSQQCMNDTRSQQRICDMEFNVNYSNESMKLTTDIEN